MKHYLSLLLIVTFLVLSQDSVFADPADGKKSNHAQSIFDGKSLNGWKAPDMSYWSVKDESITAISTDEHPCKHNQFLVWQGGEVDDFVLTLQFRVEGGPSANSGIQVRSQLQPEGHVIGYQVDISQPNVAYLGAVYDEHGRKILASRGQKTIIAADGTMTRTPLKNGPDAAIKSYKKGDWNEYQIRFKGNRIEVKLNGITTSIVIDNQESEREMSGLLALQLHSGPPMKVQFKELTLKKLKP